MCTQRISQARSVQSLRAGVQGSRDFDALSCYLSLILKHSDTNLDVKTNKTIFNWNFRGGVWLRPLTGSATELKVMWSTCNLKKLDVNCCETMNFRPYLSEKEILIYNNVVGNSRALLLSPNLQKKYWSSQNTNTNMHMWDCINAMVAVLASLTNDGNLSHFNVKSHNYSIPLRWILPTL